MSNAELFKNSFLYGSNSSYVLSLYKKYAKGFDVGSEWKSFFDNLKENEIEVLKSLSSPSWVREEVASQPKEERVCDLSVNAQMLIDAFRNKGHFLANIDPLGLEKLPSADELGISPSGFGLSDDDLRKPAHLNKPFKEKADWILEDLYAELKKTYCNKIAYEFEQIDDLEQREWLASRVENFDLSKEFDDKERLEAFQVLNKVDMFEKFLHSRFPGAKRFSVEGGDASIVSARNIIKLAALSGIKEVVFGMPHRGRLNMLAKVFNKSYQAIFAEFQGVFAHPEELDVSGDVKYHLGQSTDLEFDGNEIHVSLTPNPSHLEAVNPVVAGKVRARQDMMGDAERKQAMGVLFHGDAAFSGQGVVFESLMLDDLDAYKTGGVVHVVVNNQVGFTATRENGCKTRYCTEVAKVIKAPIFHVNGNSIEDVLAATKIASEFRHRFGKDVIIDIVCYRLHGHNEMDEPRFTQPEMYKKVDQEMAPCKIYAEELIKKNIVSHETVEREGVEFKKALEDALEKAKAHKNLEADWFKNKWSDFNSDTKLHDANNTGVAKASLTKLGIQLATIPDSVNIHKTVGRGYKARLEAINSGQGIDWGNAEMLAFGSVLQEGFRVRLTGQDSCRGTFSHRQSVIIDQQTYEKYVPLNNISENQGFYEVENSSLSEYAVLGFEYGYSIAGPNNLVIWEAQFGDFANGAQIIIDQFIASAETKWLRMSGLVMLLPHGYEGQGPEHSSARLERFLDLCAEDNMRVMNLTTPANYFHALRGQIHSKCRKPLVIMSPKSLLRHKEAVSKIEDFAENTKLLKVIDDHKAGKSVDRLVLCSGKIFYDLDERRDQEKISNIAIVRVEQLYPFPSKEIASKLSKYKNVKEVIWCQEEPKNNGAWSFVRDYIEELLDQEKLKNCRLQYVGRKASASPAAGYAKMHKQQQEEIIKKVLY